MKYNLIPVTDKQELKVNTLTDGIYNGEHPEPKEEAGTLPYTHPIYTEVSQLDKYDSIEYILKYYTLTKKQ